MRVRVILEARRQTVLPADHLDAVRGALYRVLATADPEYAAQTHDHGEGDGPHALKLFTFSGLRAPRGRRTVTADGRLILRPGLVDWWIGSPRDAFLQHIVNGMLTSGEPLDIAGARFDVVGMEAHAVPPFGERATFTCVTPIVASVPSPEGRPTAYYLRPADGDAFSAAVRQNLLRKHALLHGAPPEDDRLRLTFDPAFLARNAHGGTRRVTVHGQSVVGAMAPFTLTGAPALLRTAWDAGLGSKTGCGFGLIDVVTAPARTAVRVEAVA
jgi:CRISPR-associated endoribonuclease Cas6